jgi:1,3-beta-glucanosyltransferase GAS1
MVAIYGPNMTGVLSGAIVYEWTQEVNNYGLITYPGSAIQNNIPVPAGSPIPIQPDFDNLWSQWAAASPVGTSAAAYTPQVVTVTCPAMVSGWTIDGNAALPPAPTSLSPPAPSTYVPTTHAPYPTAVTTASVLAGSSGVSVPGQNSEAQTSASGAGGSAAGTSGASGNSATAAASGGSSTGTNVIRTLLTVAASAGTKNSMSYLFGLMGLVSTCIGLGCIVF